MLIKGALANALAFTRSSYLFSRLSKDSIDTKRKRNDLAIEQLQKAQIQWAQKDNNESISLISNSGWSKKRKPNSQN